VPGYSDILNVRKMAIALALAPLSFLLVVSIVESSVHQLEAQQAIGVRCTNQPSGEIANSPRNYECR
jgi:hypothetical protein